MLEVAPFKEASEHCFRVEYRLSIYGVFWYCSRYIVVVPLTIY
jgi:hypothetical protein